MTAHFGHMTAKDRDRARAIALSALMVLAACSTVPDAHRGEAAYQLMPAPAAVGADYVIAPDDVMRISVYREPGLSLEDARVDATGHVRLPLVGDISVAGLTANEASDAIAGRLGERYLVSPQVTIFVKQAVARRITLDGQVRRPGIYPIDGRITLQQAVAMGQGPSDDASLGQIVVVRSVQGERQAAMFDLGAIRAGRADNPEILPGDTIIIGLSRAKALVNDLLGGSLPLTSAFVAVEAGS